MSKLLIVKTSSLGDVIHALPVLSDLVGARPDLQVGWLVEEAFTCLPGLHPAGVQVIPVALRRWRRQWRAPATRLEWQAMRAALATFAADQVLDLQGLVKSAVLSCASPGERLGYRWASAREPLASLFYHRCFAVSRQQHAVQRNRALAAAALGYTLPEACRYGLRQEGSQSVALLLHATSRDDKLWPVASWQALGRALAAQGLACRLPAGNAVEAARAMAIAAAIPDAQVLPPGPLAALLPVFASARLAVGVDTGLTHLAAAYGMPVVAVYTATRPAATGVFGSACAANLGGPGQVPAVAEVLARLQQLQAGLAQVSA